MHKGVLGITACESEYEYPHFSIGWLQEDRKMMKYDSPPPATEPSPRSTGSWIMGEEGGRGGRERGWRGGVEGGINTECDFL